MRFLIALIAFGFFATAANAQMSRTCQYQMGPKLGQVQHFPGVAPVVLGGGCTDGMGSFGYAIPDQAAAVAAVGPVGTNCSFTSGIFAGRIVAYEWLGYSLPVGAYCQDGMFGQGLVTNQPATQSLTRTCRYLDGPKNGNIETFPAIEPVHIGMKCWDGVASFGIAYFDGAATPQNAWNGDPDTARDPTVAELATLAQPAPTGSPAQKTPLNAVKGCLPSMGAGEVAFTACVAQTMPADAVQQCAANCNACFGKLDMNHYSCKAVTGLAKKVGIDPTKIAKPIDKIWGVAKKIDKVFKIF